MSNYRQLHNMNQNSHFSHALMPDPEFSTMQAHPVNITTFNAGDIVPIYCREVLPEEDIDISLDFVVRQTTLLTPTMGNMDIEFQAFFVQNRVVNDSWKAVLGENYSGSWTAPSVELAPLKSTSTGTTQIPPQSVADYYGFSSEAPFPNSVLAESHDLKFRGYVMIYNEFFRDQNYQPPIPLSTLNVYQGFLDPSGTNVMFNGATTSPQIANSLPDGSYGAGAIQHALTGSAGSYDGTSIVRPRNANPSLGIDRWRALNKPFKANKHHDYFTSVLPSPQKSDSPVYAPVSGIISGGIPVTTTGTPQITAATNPLLWRSVSGTSFSTAVPLVVGQSPSGTFEGPSQAVGTGASSGSNPVYPSNLVTTSGEVTGLSLSVDDIRMASAIQQVYETLARGGSRYREMVRAFFGVEVEDPYMDIPVRLGQFTRNLDLYQTAQTSPSESGNTPQGNLAGFGYTSTGGHLLHYHALEHGYIHIFAIVRHRNIYSSYFAKDNLRRNILDFYLPQLANISEQPIKTCEINPFAPNPLGTFGYQEAWAEYRFEPDSVSGYMRTGLSDSLSVWNYADDFDSSLQISNGNWLKSNSEEILNRTLAVTSSNAPQFKGSFVFHVTKTLPMPTYSVPGMDII